METIPETSAAAAAAAEADGLEGEGLGLGLVPHKVARTETFLFGRLHPLPSSSVGPTFYNGSECRSSDLYDVAGSAGGGARTLQPFSTAFIKSPGVGMAASMGFPFTSSQWQELERQALIYKYMMASVPVPPDLLIPIPIPICGTRTLSDSSTVLNPHANLVGRSGCFNLRFSNNIDPEPGRCRRTDGKKWRCSRDVAPDQKYCERHMHRGRPRSRKHVEVPAQNQSQPAQIPRPTNPDATATQAVSVSSHNHQHHQSPGRFPKPDSNLSSPAMVSAAIQKEPRYFDPMAANLQWQMLHQNIGMRMSSNAGTNAPPVLQPFDDQLKLDFPDFSNVGSETARNRQCCLYLNTDLTTLEDPDSDQREPPRGFIDAWSITSREHPSPTSNNGKSRNSSVLKDKNLPVSSLTLSMPSGDGSTLEDMDEIQMGLGVNDSEGDHGSLKPQQLSWVNSVPWLSATPLGGPLGEVLQSSAAAGSNSAAREEGLNLMTGGWEEGGNPLDGSTRLETSPSCVLHKTLVSPSDSSGCSSPTFAAAKTENSLEWLCHSKLSS